jgi:hypothetical protein
MSGFDGVVVVINKADRLLLERVLLCMYLEGGGTLLYGQRNDRPENTFFLSNEGRKKGRRGREMRVKRVEERKRRRGRRDEVLVVERGKGPVGPCEGQAMS